MLEKKQASNLRIIINFLIIFFLGFLIMDYLTFAVINVLSNSLVTLDIMRYPLLITLVLPISCWFGVVFSANYINREYVIKMKDRIINFSFAALFLITIIYFWIVLVNIVLDWKKLSSLSFSSDSVILKLSYFLLLSPYLIFYLSSRRYIGNEKRINIKKELVITVSLTIVLMITILIFIKK